MIAVDHVTHTLHEWAAVPSFQGAWHAVAVQHEAEHVIGWTAHRRRTAPTRRALRDARVRLAWEGIAWSDRWRRQVAREAAAPPHEREAMHRTWVAEARLPEPDEVWPARDPVTTPRPWVV